jgi:hypothetical protein
MEVSSTHPEGVSGYREYIRDQQGTPYWLFCISKGDEYRNSCIEKFRSPAYNRVG